MQCSHAVCVCVCVCSGTPPEVRGLSQDCVHSNEEHVWSRAFGVVSECVRVCVHVFILLGQAFTYASKACVYT